MKPLAKKIVLCTGLRTAIGHLAKSLAHVPPEDLMSLVIRRLINKSNLDPNIVDGVLVGWVGQGSHAPNVARIAALTGSIPEKAHAMTIQANCVSSFEAICSAARHIIMGEGNLYIAGGTESMSTFPYTIQGSRGLKALRSMKTVKSNWDQLWDDPAINITDTLEEGLIDPFKRINMAATAEVCAQMFGVTRDQQDRYAYESFKRCSEGHQNGFYASHMIPVEVDGKTILETDEYVALRKNLIKKPEMIRKAPALFDSRLFSIKDFYEKFGEHVDGKEYKETAKASVTLFNSCVRSDGAAAVIVTSEDVARELGLEILGELKAWSFYGTNPAHMGISPVFATQTALERAQIKFTDLDAIELHEAFASTCLSIFHVGKEKFGHNWQQLWDDHKLNPNGGSIPLGHPLGATGTRVVVNLLYALKGNPNARLGLAAACASGGLGAALIIEKPQS